MTRNLLLSLCVSSLFFGGMNLFSQEPSPDEVHVSDDALLASYFEEMQQLVDEFTPLFQRLKESDRAASGSVGRDSFDYERWEKEYYLPLLAKARAAMGRVSGTDDYLAMWENRIPQRLLTSLQNWYNDPGHKDETSIPYIRSSSLGLYMRRGTDLLTLSSLAVLYERRRELLNGTIYEDSEDGSNYRETSRVFSAYFRLGTKLDVFDFETGNDKVVRDKLGKLGIWYVFPPRFRNNVSFDESWLIMAIYSFKNERSRNILYELATQQDPIAQWASYYLALSPESREFLPKVKSLVAEKIDSFQKQEPSISRTLFDRNGALLDPLIDMGRTTSDFRHDTTTQEVLRSIFQLLVLERALEFNEKVPEEERERFELVRLEQAISWALIPKMNHRTPDLIVRLKDGEERFVIYNVEYYFPHKYLVATYREGVKTSDELRAFYEKELDDPIYTERQKKFIQNELDKLDKSLKK